MRKRKTKKALQKIRNDPYSTYWKKKALIVWGKIVRERDGKCLYCGSKLRLNAHHLLCKERYPKYMFDLNNGFTMCSKHHRRGNPSAHTHGIWFSKFLRKRYSKVLAWAEKRVDHFGRIDKIDYKQEYNRLSEIYLNEKG